MLRTAIGGICFLLAGCAGSQRLATADCRWPVAPVVLHQAADTVFLAWSYRAARLPERGTLAELPALSSFLDTVRVRTATLDPRRLLERQIAYYGSQPDPDSQGEAANGRLVLTGSAGILRPISCLEALLVEYQAQRYPMSSHPTEFQALVMARRDEVRVYFTGSSAPWPPKGDVLFAHAAADRLAGWRVVAHIHNHPFLFSSTGDIAGANAPSLTDVQFWRHLRDSIGVESARVTNGISTFEATAASFDLLQARASSP